VSKIRPGNSPYEIQLDVKGSDRENGKNDCATSPPIG
jgi:hypothetical protein